MSDYEPISTTIEKLYTVDQIITALQKYPHNYAGEMLHSNEAHTLKKIAENEGISQTQLSEQMFRTTGATSMMVDKLVKKGLVRRERQDGNQRRYLLSLTQRGLEVHRAHMAYDTAQYLNAQKSLGFEKEELEKVNATLDKLIDFFSKNYLDHGRHI